MSCTDSNGKQICPPKQKTCSAFELSKAKDSCYIDGIVGEGLAIAGADMNVYKILGIYEQQLTANVTSTGGSLSSDSISGYEDINVLSTNALEWRSSSQNAFIGVDFGEIIQPAKEGRAKIREYTTDTYIQHHIIQIKFTQSVNPLYRAKKVRVERSLNGKDWFGVSIHTIEDTEDDQILNLNQSVSSRFWRIKLVEKNNATTTWGVKKLEFITGDKEDDINTIQDHVFSENRNLEFSKPVTIKGHYDMIDIVSDLTIFGIELPSQTIYATINFNDCVALLGRPVIVGDIVELPSETMFAPDLTPIKKFLEITDIGWSTDGFTPGWTPTLLRMILQPAIASEETQDIFGDLTQDKLPEGFFEPNKNVQDQQSLSEHIQSESNELVPQRGAETKNIKQLSDTEKADILKKYPGISLDKFDISDTHLWTEDALPPTGIKYTTGDELPENTKLGEYHRLTYTQVTNDIIPARLYRYSTTKNRWIHIETDKREQYNSDNPSLAEFIRNTRS